MKNTYRIKKSRLKIIFFKDNQVKQATITHPNVLNYSQNSIVTIYCFAYMQAFLILYLFRFWPLDNSSASREVQSLM